MTKRIFTADDIKLEMQIEMCQDAIFDYFKAKNIQVDFRTLFSKFDHPAQIMQFAHMISFLKYDWKNALSFCVERRNECVEHFNQHERARLGEDSSTVTSTDAKADGRNVGIKG